MHRQARTRFVALLRVAIVFPVVAIGCGSSDSPSLDSAMDGGGILPEVGTNTADAAPAGAGDLLALIAAHPCAAANMVSAHVYSNPGKALTNIPICAMKDAVYFTAGMAIDCDGRATAGKCPGDDPSYLNDTAFHNSADQPLAAAETPYVVLPEDFAFSGIDTVNGGNVVAVLYMGRVEYAVFGDTGPTDLLGEASYACADDLGIPPDPASGGVDSGVTYVVFTSAGGKPANIEDRAATEQLGSALAAQLLVDNR